MNGLRLKSRQRGISLVGLIFVTGIVACVFLLGMQVIPSIAEYSSIKKAIVSVKSYGKTPLEIRNAFDKQADVGYITAIQGKDLVITKVAEDDYDVSFAYSKKLELFGPVSLVIDYAGTTSNKLAKPGVAAKSGI
jgi:Domain of unknown function (DUF4845)